VISNTYQNVKSSMLFSSYSPLHYHSNSENCFINNRSITMINDEYLFEIIYNLIYKSFAVAIWNLFAMAIVWI